MNYNEKMALILRHATQEERREILGVIDDLYRKYIDQDSQGKKAPTKHNRKREGRRILKLVSINGKSPPRN